MILHPSLRLLPALCAAALATSAHAADEPSMFSLSGFATLGVVKTNSDEATYVIFGQPRGATKSVSSEVDSKLGVQLTAKFSPMFSGTVQVLSKQNGDGNYTPEVEWAFVKAQLMPSLTVRVGRMGGPFFAVSDFRDVGYANTWLRPPPDVYGQVPVSRFDGADLIYQTNTGLGSVTAQLFGGKAKSVVTGTEVELKSLIGFNTTLELDGGLSLRFGHLQGKLTVRTDALNSLVGLLRGVPIPAVASVGDQLDPNNKKATFTGVGASWDQGDWLVNAEYTQRRTDTYAPDTNGWYVTVGHRFGKFTPYGTLSQLKQVDSNVDNTIPASGYPPALQGQLNALSAGVNATVAGQRRNQKTQGVGVRWDAMRSVAVKGQIDRIKPDGPGLFSNVPSNFANRVTVYSLAVDLVF